MLPWKPLQLAGIMSRARDRSGLFNRTDSKQVGLTMQTKGLLKIILGLTVLAVLLFGAYKADHLWWWVKVGGIRGEKIRVRSEIDGVIQDPT